VTKGPVLIEIDAPAAAPETAQPVPEAAATGAAMKRAVALATPRGRSLGAWVLTALATLVSFLAGVAIWDYGAALLQRSALLGAVVVALGLVLALTLVLLILRELVGLARLRRLDRLQAAGAAALAAGDRAAAAQLSTRIAGLYAGRPGTDWAQARLAERLAEALDADAVLALVETEVLAPLDRVAEAEVTRAARQVAAVTALVPLAFADVLGALAANLRMIRAIAEIYGGRSGTLGNWRLARAVMGHVMATGVVAIGDDLLGSTLGGGLVAKLSRRFGEGVVNGAMTVRVGLAAIEVCRPLAFRAVPHPGATALLGRALKGLFGADAG
jgi:putative membrane protein